MRSDQRSERSSMSLQVRFSVLFQSFQLFFSSLSSAGSSGVFSCASLSVQSNVKDTAARSRSLLTRGMWKQLEPHWHRTTNICGVGLRARGGGKTSLQSAATASLTHQWESSEVVRLNKAVRSALCVWTVIWMNRGELERGFRGTRVCYMCIWSCECLPGSLFPYMLECISCIM